MTLLSRIASALGRRPEPVAADVRPVPSAGFMRDGRGPTMMGWRPVLREPARDVERSWRPAAARTLDILHNSGFVSGGIDQAVADIVGPDGLRLNARPDADTFGLTSEQANALGRAIETQWALYAETPIDVDAEARATFGKLQAQAMRHWFATGEVLAVLPSFRRAGGAWRPKVRVVPAMRLSTRTDGTLSILHGVRLDRQGASVAFLFREAPENGAALTTTSVNERELPARDGFGRPIVVHVFDGMPGQIRGISPLTPALQVARQFDQLANATLTGEILRAVFVATLEADTPTLDAMAGLQTQQEQARAAAEGVSPFDAYLDASAGWTKGVDLDMGVAGRIAHLFPGQKLNVHESSKAASNYKDFVKLLLHEIARCLGLTVESLSVDWNGTTYTGARVATAQIHHVTMYRRKNILTPFCRAVYEAWLEDAVTTERIAWPGGVDAFLGNRPAACRSIWRGPPRAVVDDLKTAKAHEIWARLGVMTDEAICNELGCDVEDVYEQRKREQDMRAEYGLPERTFAGAADPRANDRETDDDADPSGA
jgi:lambda family phage portal protein